MALAALIAAYHESGEGGALRATLPLAGRTVIERQARLAARAGATRIVVLVERMPAELAAALDRLRRERLPIQIARSAEDAAELIDPSQRLLLIADGAVTDASELARLAEGEGTTILTVPDSRFGELYERIDATSRWGGVAAVEGSLLRATADMLRDWDLQSTLLRRAIQAGARHLAADAPVAIIDGANDIAALEKRIVAHAAEARGGWASRALAPVERVITSLVMASPLTPPIIGTTAAVLTALGAGAFAYNWSWAGLALMLLATPLEGTATRLARLRMQEDGGRSWWCNLIPAFAGAGLVGLSYGLAPVHGWGVVLLALMVTLFLVAQRIETGGRDIRGTLLLADRKGMTWLMLPFALFGAWAAGLALLFVYTAGSFFWAQHQSHRGTAPRQD